MVAVLLVLAVAVEDKAAEYAAPKMLVTPAALAKMTPGKDAVVLDVRPRKDFLAGHVAGARWVDAAAWGKAATRDEDAAAWGKRVGALGIDGTLPVVVYDDDRMREAARAWWILRYWGVKDVRLVNGGWKALVAAGATTTTEEPVIPAASPKLEREAKRLATLDQLREQLAGGKVGQLLDARSRGEHCGESKTAKRNGAIPGAKHLEWTDTIDAKTGRVKPAAELAKLFKDAGLDLEQPVTTYCQSGGRAAVAAFVVELMTGKPARNYYRSWAEWGNETDTPVATPKK